MRLPTMLRRFAVVLPLILAATAMPVAAPQRKPEVRHFTMAAKAEAVRAPGDFSLVGLSVPDDAPKTAGVRVSPDGKRWGGWAPMEFEAEVGPDLDSNEKGTHTSMPLWTGNNRYVQVRGVPAGTKVHAFDPGPDPAAPGSSAMASPSKPGIITRAQWGADESIRKGGSDYAGSLRMAVVHHTATTDSYAKSESDNIVRSIYAYHVKTNGWDDIGYNFLVDRYGQIFEGRYGGVDRNVIGAHSQGFNTGSTGISIIGNFASIKPPEIAMNSLKRILAWRLDQGTVDPGGSLTYVSNGSNKYPQGTKVSLKTIIGHRNVGQTECPGNPLYNALPSLRIAARKDGLPKLFDAKVSRAAITPNSDGVADSLKVTGRFSSALSWKAQVLDSAGTTVWQVSGYGTTLAPNFYGKNSAGNYLSHGSYRFRITGKNSSGSLRSYYVPFSIYRWPAGTYFLALPSKMTYIVQGKGTLRHPSHWTARASRYGSEYVTVSDSITKYYPRGADIGFREGSIASVDGKVFLISEGKRRPTTKTVLANKGWDTDAIIATTNDGIRLHPAGSTFGSSSAYPNGAALFATTSSEAWLIGGVARPFSNQKVRASYKIRGVDLAGPADSIVASGATSQPLGFRDGTLLRVGTTTIYLVSGGRRRPFSSSKVFSRMGFEKQNITAVTPAELALHDEGKPL